MTTILVTGATGVVGSKLVKQLLKNEKVHVRIGVRSPEKARQMMDGWNNNKADIVPLDYDKPETLNSVFEGVDRLFILTPLSDSFVPQVHALVEAAKAAHVKFILRMSGLGAAADALVFVSRGHAECDDKIVKISGIAWCIICPNWFQDNVINYSGAGIMEEGNYYGASAPGKTAYISADDIAACAAEILVRPDSHASKTYILSGPEAISDEQLAEMVSKVLNKKVQYVNLTREQFKRGIMSAGIPEIIAEAVSAFEELKVNGTTAQLSPHVESILGRPPESYEAFLERTRSWWPSV